MPHLPKVILFDADGTLYASERLNYKANQSIARQFHDFDYTWELYDEHVRRGSKKSYEILEMHGVGVEPEVWLARKHAAYQKLAVENLVPMRGLPAFLKWCQAKKIRCIVVSAARLDSIEFSVATLGITDSFEAIISNENVGPLRKPHPQSYILGLELAGVEAAEAIAVEDTAKGIASAKGAGLYCIGIRNDTNSAEELAAADHVIDDYDELKAYLQRSA